MQDFFVTKKKSFDKTDTEDKKNQVLWYKQ